MKTLSLVGIFSSITGILATVLILVIGQKYLLPVIEFPAGQRVPTLTSPTHQDTKINQNKQTPFASFWLPYPIKSFCHFCG